MRLGIGLSIGGSGLGGGSAWAPDRLSGLYAAPAVAVMRSAGNLWQDAAKTTPAVANNDPVRVAKCTFSGVEFTAPSDAARPLLTTAGGLWWFQIDGTDDCFDFAGLASRPLSVHAAFNQNGAVSTSVVVAGGNGSQKFKAYEPAVAGKMIGGVEGVRNWTQGNTVNTAGTDHVVGIDYAATGAAVNWRDGVSDGQAWADVNDGSLTANVTRVGRQTGAGTEQMKGKLYGWAIYSQHQADADLFALHQYLAALQGRTL